MLKPNKGLPKREITFEENIIKGRIAETLIEQLFLALGYKVFRYGMENTIPGVMEYYKNVPDEIRFMPDFVIQNDDGKTFFIEVKFRGDGYFNYNKIKDKKYPKNCYFVVVTRKHIKCITYKELEQGKKIIPKSKNWLGSRDEFKLDKEVIKQFCKFATKFFKNV